MSTEYKFEVGGSVQISGKWYWINKDNMVDFGRSAVLCAALTDIIQDYRPPVKEQKPFEWMTEDEWHGLDWEPYDGCTHPLDAINAFLTERYGDPTERKYNGEPAEEFGLTGGECILYLDPNDGEWRFLDFCSLDEGDIWRKQPPVLQNWWYHQF